MTYGRFLSFHDGWLASSCGAFKGLEPNDWKPMQTVGPGVREIRIDIGGAHRVFYVATQAEAIYVLHAFEKKARTTSARDLEIGRDRFRALGKLRQHDGKEERG